MSRDAILKEALALSPAERIELVEDLWDSIAAIPESVVLTDAQRAELAARLVEYHHDPTAGSPWEEVKQRLLSRR
ncbi:MAG TPA: addiction module protein [Phycisphaerae bacterium]|nr:addiction module protein [Phycisphaerae bacterium]